MRRGKERKGKRGIVRIRAQVVLNLAVYEAQEGGIRYGRAIANGHLYLSLSQE